MNKEKGHNNDNDNDNDKGQQQHAWIEESHSFRNKLSFQSAFCPPDYPTLHVLVSKEKKKWNKHATLIKSDKDTIHINKWGDLIY